MDTYEMKPGHKVRVVRASNPLYNQMEGIVLNPRDVYGMFEGGSMPIFFDNTEGGIKVFHPSEVIRIPKRGSI